MQETFNHGAKKQFGKQQYGENAYVQKAKVYF